MKNVKAETIAIVQVCNDAETAVWDSAGCYKAEDIVRLRINICNNGTQELKHISVSHMIRDYLLFIPDTLKADNGDASLLFQLVRWRINLLKPGECATLFFKVKIKELSANLSISLTASYTFQILQTIYGPYQAQGALLEIEKREP
jgi:hypothetical protein